MTLDPLNQPNGESCNDDSHKAHIDDKQTYDHNVESELYYLHSFTMPLSKRLMDIFGAVLGLFVLSPIFFMAAILIKATSKGPVIFRQQRIGYLGQPFTILKFRTMVVETDMEFHKQYVTDLLQNEKPLRKLDHQKKLIPFGKYLRKFYIDELPQLFNVLGGSMSLVGPRPDVIAMEKYSRWQRQRFNAYPGMTGLWQVSGKNTTTHNEMIQLDIEYASQRSILLDIKTLLKTFPIIAKQLTDNDSN